MKLEETKINFGDTVMDAVKISKEGIEMTVLVQIGPRIAELRIPGGENLLLKDESMKAGRGEWRVIAGHRVWTTRPGADECEESYATDNEPCSYKIDTSDVDRFDVLGAVHPVFKIQRVLIIKENKHKGSLDVVSVVRNCSDMLWSGGVWAITCMHHFGKNSYAVPIGNAGTGGWDVSSVTIPKSWAGHKSPVNDPQLVRNEDLLIINPMGTETKRMIKASQGWIGCLAPEQKCSFFKLTHFQKDQHENYPERSNVAFYIGPENSVVELETMSPTKTLMPRESIEHTERWILTKPTEWKNFCIIQNTMLMCRDGIV